MLIERKNAVRVVLDTSVWVSALLWTGLPNQLLKLIENEKIKAVISPVLVTELREVLGRDKFASIMVARESSVPELMREVLKLVELYEPASVSGIVERDPDDDNVIACAIAGKVQWIISGDDDLLDIEKYKDILIGSPKRFLEVEFPDYL